MKSRSRSEQAQSRLQYVLLQETITRFVHLKATAKRWTKPHTPEAETRVVTVATAV
jgi:hypothetical protein